MSDRGERIDATEEYQLAMVEVARRSDVGRRRTHNEDRDLVAPPVLAVADGLGGQRAGEVAASIAVDALARVVANPTPTALRAAAEEANRTIRRVAGRSPERAGMGTTLTALLLTEGRVVVAHVGDSRAYLFRDGQLTRITSDHSVVAELVRRGDLTLDDAARHPQRNVITRALGAEPVVRVDQPETAVRAGDVVLVCSDGLTSLVPDDEISAIMGAEGDLDACAAALTAAANLAGGIDNITVVLARLGIGPQAALVPSERPKSGDTAPHPLIPAAEPVTVLGRTPPSPRRSADLPSRRTPVLEPVRRPRRRRRGRTPLVLSIVLLAGVAATASWIGSRSYFVEVDGSGMARVSHGLPFDLLGIRAYREWQGLDVPAAPIRAAEPSAVNRRIMGQGEAAALAGRLVWQYGLPVIP